MRAKIIKWILWLAASIVLMFVALLFVTPALLNSDFIRTKIITLVAEEIGAELEYQNVMLVFTPLPTFQIEQIKFDFPDIIDIHADRIKLSPNFVKLLSGGGFVDSLRLEKPEVRLDLPQILAPSPDPITEAELWVILTQIISPLIAYTPELNVALVDGSFDLADKTDSPFFVHGIDAELTLNAEQEALNVELTGQFTNLAFKVNDATTQLNVQKLSASTILHPDLINLRLNNLSLKRAELDFDGELSVTRTDPKFKLSLASQVPDLIKLFPFLRPLLTKMDGSDQIFDSILGGSLKNISMQSEAGDILGLFDYNVMSIDARLEEGEFFLSRLAHKVDNVSGRLRIADRRIELSDSHLESGQTYANIEKIAVYRKNKEAPFMLDIDNTHIHFDLAALHKNLYDFPAIKTQLDEIESISGQLEVNMIKLKGPLAKLDDWKFKANGSIAETVIDTPRFPAPITVQSGSYLADEHSVAFKEVHLKGLDADLTFSGEISGKIPIPTSIEASVTGKIDENINQWIRETTGLPDTYALNPPISIKHVSMFWKSGNNVVAKGDFKPSGGPTISGDISYSPPKNLQVEVSLSDQNSNAKISILSKENNLKVAFSGKLQKETINNIFVQEQLSSGRIAGDFNLELNQDNGIQITTSGKLQGENMLLPIDTKKPISISDFSVTGRDQMLEIDHLNLEYGEERAEIKGSIGGINGNYQLDLDVHTGPLDLLELINQYEDIRGGRPEKEPNAEPGLVADVGVQPQDLPFSGRIGLEVENLSLKHLKLTPLRADIQFAPQLISAQIVEANLCGIDLLATAHIIPGEIELTLPLQTLDQDFQKSSICLSGKRSNVSGLYDLKGAFSTKGTPTQLIDAATGTVSLHARDGAIEQSPLLSQILKVVNLTEFYRGDYLTLDKDKLGYKLLQIEGQLANKRMDVSTFHFDGHTLDVVGAGYVDLIPMNMDMELILAPLKTVDTVIKWLPGINYLLAGTLVTVPARLTGPPTDLDVNIMPAGSVGKGLLNLTERVLKIPVKLVEPLTGEDIDEAKGSAEPEAP